MAKSKRVEFKYADIAIALQECPYQDGRQFVTDIYLRAGVPLERANQRAKSALSYIGNHDINTLAKGADLKRIEKFLPHTPPPILLNEPKSAFNLDLSGLDLLLEIGMPKKDVERLASDIDNHTKRQIYSTGMNYIHEKLDDLRDETEKLQEAERKLNKLKPATRKK